MLSLKNRHALQYQQNVDISANSSMLPVNVDISAHSTMVLANVDISPHTVAGKCCHLSSRSTVDIIELDSLRTSLCIYFI